MNIILKIAAIGLALAPLVPETAHAAPTKSVSAGVHGLKPGSDPIAKLIRFETKPVQPKAVPAQNYDDSWINWTPEQHARAATVVVEKIRLIERREQQRRFAAAFGR